MTTGDSRSFSGIKL